MNAPNKTDAELKLLHSIVDTLPAIIYITSKKPSDPRNKTTVEWMNSYGLSMLHYTPDDLKGLTSGIYPAGSDNQKTECIFSLNDEEKETIPAESSMALWRFYCQQSTEPFYCWEQSQLMPSFALQTTERKIVIGHIFTPNQLNRPQMSLLLRQIYGTRYQHYFDSLTTRETEIIRLVLKGNTCVKISNLLGIRQSTVRKHRDNIMRKLSVRNVAQLITMAMEYGFTY